MREKLLLFLLITSCSRGRARFEDDWERVRSEIFYSNQLHIHLFFHESYSFAFL